MSISLLKYVFTVFTKPATPPETWMNVIKEPTKNVKIITLVFPGSWNTFTIPSIVKRSPLNIFHSPIISHPIKIPVKREINTCFVLIAKKIAIRGGITDKNPYSCIVQY